MKKGIVLVVAISLFCITLIFAQAPEVEPEGTDPASSEVKPDEIARAVAAFQEIVSEAKKKALPSLVFIKPVQERLEGGEAKRRQIYGSGVIIDREGHVITNNHVAEKTKEIRCVLFDKSEMDATVVGLDEATDLAVIKLDLSEYKGELPVATLGTSSMLSEGNFVLALGAPMGFSRSVSLGVVSNLERYFESAPYTLWIQTDAAINPGNSGGPLVNLKGEVIGINSMKIPFADNLGFAIPVDLVKDVVKKLIENAAKTGDEGKIARSWTGIKFQEMKDFSESETIKGEEGVLVGSIHPNSPASKAGLRPGDIILGVNGKKVNCIYQHELPATQRFFAALPLDKDAELTVLRGDETTKVNIVPKIRGKREGDEMECKDWGMTVREIEPLTPVFSHFRDRGVFVLGLKYKGNANKSGLQEYDIIVKLADVEINSLGEFEAEYNELIKMEKGHRKVLVEVNRFGYPRYVVVDFNKEPEEDEE